MAAELALASSGMMTPFADALRPKLKLSKRFSFHDREPKAPLHAACGGRAGVGIWCFLFIAFQIIVTWEDTALGRISLSPQYPIKICPAEESERTSAVVCTENQIRR